MIAIVNSIININSPFQLVSPYPWPIFTSINLLTLTTCGVLIMHGFTVIGNFFFFLAGY